jgi:hypothetical protein
VRFLRHVALVALVAVVGCQAPRSTRELVFLTRVGCAQTPQMKANLDAALDRLKWPHDYRVIDIGTLGQADPHVGYPTPTLLWRDADIFGMPVPVPPYPVPT